MYQGSRINSCRKPPPPPPCDSMQTAPSFRVIQERISPRGKFQEATPQTAPGLSPLRAVGRRRGREKSTFPRSDGIHCKWSCWQGGCPSIFLLSRAPQLGCGRVPGYSHTAQPCALLWTQGWGPYSQYSVGSRGHHIWQIITCLK